MNELYKAIINADIKAVESLIKGGVDIDAKDSDGDTPLIAACNVSNIEIVDLLIKYGANINVINKEGCSPLIRTIYRNNIDMVKLLIKNGANLDLRLEKNFTPLMTACYFKHEEMALLLIKAGADLKLCYGDGDTALNIARHKGLYKVIDLMKEILIKELEDKKLFINDIVNTPDGKGIIKKIEETYSGNILYTCVLEKPYVVVDYYSSKRSYDYPAWSFGYAYPANELSHYIE